MLSKKIGIFARGLSKAYEIHSSQLTRLKHMLIKPDLNKIDLFYAVKGVDLELRAGQSLGIIGENGAGKSTLLQLICGNLAPTSGDIEVIGRVAPLLELGAGFNLEFTGMENIFLNASLLGLSKDEILYHLEDIIDFADIGSFIDQPVRVYSTGMYMRLAFAIATVIRPDILVIDESISVGDGRFARKSFNRIMELKEQGVIMLFCSHSLFHVESLCEEALWIHQGQVKAQGKTQKVLIEYNNWIDRQQQVETNFGNWIMDSDIRENARFLNIEARCDGITGNCLTANSSFSTLEIKINFHSDPEIPTPTAAVGIILPDNRILTSCGTWIDDIILERSADGKGVVTLSYPNLPLLKGEYSLSAALLCERGIHIYDYAERVISLEVKQNHRMQGLVDIPHYWR